MKKTKSISDWMSSALVKGASQAAQPAPPSHRPRRKVAKQQQPRELSTAGRASQSTPPLSAGSLLSDEPWSVKYEPRTASDLTVHKKKVAEVQQWLEFALSAQGVGRRCPMLLLTGPPGCGKTATLRALSHDLHFSILEWVNPSTEGQSTNDTQVHPGDLVLYPESQTKQFKDFVTRANRYPALQVGGAGESALKKVVLVEEFPNAFIRDPSRFHDTMRVVGGRLHYPLVFIVSESHRGSSSSSSLFSKAALSSVDVHTISFNPVAHTSLVKTLQRMASTECQSPEGGGGRSRTNRGAGLKFHMPPRDVIERLAESSAGDIRSATNALQFACLKDSSALVSCDADVCLQPLKPSVSRRRKGSSSVSVVGGSRLKRQPSRLTPVSLSGIGGRDSALFLFRALGKILHCKRDAEVGGPSPSPSPRLPPVLEQHRRAALLVDPESVVEHSHLSSEMFVLYLHQNYVSFYEDLDDIARGVEYLSDSDVIGGLWTDAKDVQASLQVYSSSVGCRGVMHSNDPTHHASSGGHWRPLHKPQWSSVSRQVRENCQTARGLFLHLGASPHVHLWTPVELQTEILPYLAIINVPLRNPGQVSFLQTVTYFGSGFHRLRPEALGERDAGETSNPDQTPSVSAPPPASGSSSSSSSSSSSTSQAGALSQDVRLVAGDDEPEIDDFEDDLLW